MKYTYFIAGEKIEAEIVGLIREGTFIDTDIECITMISMENYEIDGKIETYPEEFGRLTISLGHPVPVKKEDGYVYGFVDTNNLSGAIEFIAKYTLGEICNDDSGKEVWERSGFCIYPLYKFSIEQLKKYEFQLEQEV